MTPLMRLDDLAEVALVDAQVARGCGDTLGIENDMQKARIVTPELLHRDVAFSGVGERRLGVVVSF